MRMKALGANWPVVIVGRLLRLVGGFQRQAEREHEAAGQSARHQRATRGQRTDIAMCICKFMMASYAWPSAARLIASRMRT